MRQAVGVSHPEAMSWDLPEHEAAPQGMNMPIMVWLRNLALGWDMEDYGRMRYNLLGSGGHWFPGTNAAKLEAVAAKDFEQAVGRSPHARKIREILNEAHALLAGEAVKRLSKSE